MPSSVFAHLGARVSYLQEKVCASNAVPGASRVHPGELPSSRFELLHQRPVIEGRPDLPDFASGDGKGVDAGDGNSPPARRHTPKFPLVGSVHRGEAGEPVSIGDHDLDRETGRESISQDAGELDKVYGTVDTGGTIEDEIGRQNLVCRRQVSSGDHLVEEATDERSMCF